MLRVSNLLYVSSFLFSTIPCSASTTTTTTRLTNHHHHQQQQRCETERQGCIGLECFDEWKAEEGYWIGEYSFYQADGTPYQSEAWNYPYHSYRGFVTAALKCNKFRQRNVFLYPPQSKTICKENNNSTIGEGTCGVHGNSKVFFADQEQDPTHAAHRELNDGSIKGTYAGGMYTTKTTLVGDGTAVLYQVLDSDKKLHLNQLTSITVSEEDGMRRRMRTAQAFTPQGHPMAMSYYREREVTEEEFFSELAATLIQYNILPSDTCAWTDYGPKPTNYTHGIDGCIEHLLEAFEIKHETCDPVIECTEHGSSPTVEGYKFEEIVPSTPNAAESATTLMSYILPISTLASLSLSLLF